MSEINKKYLLDTAENEKFLEEIRNTLFSFGHRFPALGGSSYYLGDDGTPWTDRNRETWITSRMVHVYSIASFLGHEGSIELAAAGLKGLTGELHDKINGGWYAGLTADGQILPNKQCYAHAFVILAASSATLAGIPGAKELLDEALALYDLRFWNEEEGLSSDTWNTEFTVLDDYRGLNANMHTVEAFLAAADVTGDEKYRVRAGRIIDHVKGWAKDNNWRIPEHFTSDWTADLECNKDKPDDQFKPYGATPGHGIEWSRLIVQWALSTYKDDMEKVAAYIEISENLYNRAIADAWNADGAPGITYTTDWEGKPVVHDRMHWTLAEAINTSAVLAHVTGKEKYAADYAEFMQYLDEKVLDHENGSWFHQLDRENNVIGTVWPGKSDLYHAVQATLIPYYAAGVSIAPAVKAGEKIMKDFGKVFILGDSYSTFEGYIPEGYAPYYINAGHNDTDVNKVEQTWWHQLIAETQAELVQNCSYSGTTVCHTGYEKSDCKEISFIGRLDKLIKAGYFKENPVDTFIVFGGTNDSWADSPVGELKYSDWSNEELYSVLPAFCYLLHQLSVHLPEAKVICVINTELKPVIEENFKIACEHYKIDVAALHEIDKMCGHPTIAGMKQIKDQILAV